MKTQVELSVGGRKQKFDIEHAERLLKLQNNGGWKLTDKGFKFNGKALTKQKS